MDTRKAIYYLATTLLSTIPSFGQTNKEATGATNFLSQINYTGFKAKPERSKHIDFMAEPASPPNFALDSLYQPEKNYQFEFRLYQETMYNQGNTVFVMTLVHNRWTARYFIYDTSTKQEGRLKEVSIDQQYLDELWSLLVSHAVLELPDQKALQSQLIHYSADTLDLPFSPQKSIITIDGTMYRFSLSTPQKQRTYTYANPKGQLAMSSNIKELYDAFAIIALIKKFLNIPCEVG
ncbi:hypothetical protein FW774_10105 [Pedobacter sp. BS3]|uniref:hypothetical protein n=1 Tax=Pedobacter sp. BS3 TaxID=2567937 RepID=UPI0011F03BBC|nr:hypothetical protein [Pedobacter sp. BS3]TZF83810.1 hypothetical protein FW774_10105 [Pedobacter sp. BS3]